MTPARILIIEHNEGVRENLSRMLTQQGYDVRSAVSAEQALQGILSANGPEITDCIIFDLDLPDSTAIETVNFIRGHFPGIPLVGLWESPDFGISSVLTDLGVRKFVYKSVDKNLLLKTLESLLTRPSPSGG